MGDAAPQGETSDQAILSAFLKRVAIDSPLLTRDPLAVEQLMDQATQILDMSHRRLNGHGDATGTTAPPNVGANRAQAHVHPSESLRAAGALFAAALPRLTRKYEGRIDPTEVALHLHGCINDLLVQAAVSYVDVLLDRLSGAHQEERRRIARDLHDRTSHGIGAAIQGVDLALFRMDSGTMPDTQSLTGTRRVLLDTLNDVRDMSSRLRDAVGDRSLVAALRDFITLMSVDDVHFTESADRDGQPANVPAFIKEEAYLILREGLRNAVVHGVGRTRIQVSVDMHAEHLRATVSDDGAGFDLNEAATRRTVGLSSMNERAEGLGGSVVLRTHRGGGVQLELMIPVPQVDS